MAMIFFRSCIIYIVVLIIMRFMGKRQIGEMQPFEFVVTLLIAELACIPMSDISIPLVYGITAIIAVFILHQFMTIFEHLGATMKIILSGKPSVVINKNGVDFKELKRNNLDVSDLIESMRGLGYFSLDSVEYAIYESNGTLSAIEKEEKAVPSMPILLINNGKTQSKSLSILKYNKEEVENFLKKHKIKNLKNVGVMTVDGNGRCYIQEFGKKYSIESMLLKEGVSW